MSSGLSHGPIDVCCVSVCVCVCVCECVCGGGACVSSVIIDKVRGTKAFNGLCGGVGLAWDSSPGPCMER